jgi:hypothetical protein
MSSAAQVSYLALLWRTCPPAVLAGGHSDTRRKRLLMPERGMPAHKPGNAAGQLEIET